ncbi:MAG: sulfotransferase [Dokdonella sp.]
MSSDPRLHGLSAQAQHWLGLASEAIERRDPGAADAALTQARLLVATHPEYLRLLGLVRYLQRRHDEALAAFRLAFASRPTDPSILVNLATVLRDAGQVDDAVATLHQACTLAPGFAPAWNNLGLLLSGQGAVGEANAAYARALACEPGHIRARTGYAETLNNLGRTEEAVRELRQVLRAQPMTVQAWTVLSNIKTAQLTAEEAAWLERVFVAPGIGEDDRVRLGFALAKALEDQDRYDAAFDTYRAANAIKRRTLPWNAQAFSRHVDALIAAFSTPLHAAPPTLGSEVIFVVSLPRAGSTLTEQILASHPDVEGAEELPDLQRVLDAESQRLGAELAQWAPRAGGADWQRLGQEYLQRTAHWRQSRPHFSDKSLDTWRHLGAAAAMLPGARFVHVFRDPVETCLSCFRQLFDQGHAYSYDLADMAAYWRDYDRLMRFWRERHPQQLHDFGYEALLANPEQEIRRLLAFCGLPFDAGCLGFHKTRRSVRTVSAAQVREPLRGDTARAERYGARLASLRQALAGAPPLQPSR